MRKLLLVLSVVCVLALGMIPAAAGINKEEAGKDDKKLEELFRRGDDSGIVHRYRSTDRIKELSPAFQDRLLQYLIERRPEMVLETFSRLISTNDEVAAFAIVAALRAGRPITISRQLQWRISQSTLKQLSAMVNRHELPPAGPSGAVVRNARQAALNAYFFKSDTSLVERRKALHELADRTTEAFRKNTFTPEAPSPPTGWTARSEEQFVLQLGLLAYMKSSHFETFFRWFERVSGTTEE